MQALLLTTLAVLIAALPAHAQLSAAELAKERAALPDAVEKVAEKGAGIASKLLNKVGSVGKASKPSKSDPMGWKKDEVHKLAVMDIEFGGNTETVMFELLQDVAPQHVANFIENASGGAYRGLAFHRAIDGYLVQTGDPLSSDDSQRSSWGTGGEEKTVNAETKGKHKFGVVGMARRRSSDRSNGYQFYFGLGNLSSLDGSYSVFGQVVSGLDVLEAISRVPVDSNDCPLSRIEVRSVRIVDQKGPLVAMRDTGSGSRRIAKPSGAKTGFSRFLDRVW
jgi:cyclophilin family peptidyl-prolyl cis-trans isomerase